MRFRMTAPLAAVVGVLLIAVTACTSSASNPSATVAPSASLAAIAPAVDAAVADPSFDLEQLRALVVSVDGSVVVERYYHSSPQEYADLQSVTKSIVSTLIGIAIGEGRIPGVDATLDGLLPQYRRIMHPRVAQTTIRQLLTMTAGWTVREEQIDRGLVKRWLREGPLLPPGKQFEYNNVGPQLLAEVLAQATGMSVLDYARLRLFDPLHIGTRPAYQGRINTNGEYWTQPGFKQPGFAWVTAPDGVNAGPFGMKLRVIDMLRIGQLYLNDGRWEGRQIVPTQWIHDATAADSANLYGYLWWVHPVDRHPGYAAQGTWGQVILVVPDRKLVVAASSRISTVDKAGDPIFRLVDAAIAPYLGR